MYQPQFQHLKHLPKLVNTFSSFFAGIKTYDQAFFIISLIRNGLLAFARLITNGNNVAGIMHPTVTPIVKWSPIASPATASDTKLPMKPPMTAPPALDLYFLGSK
jgi:hypothetical protein